MPTQQEIETKFWKAIKSDRTFMLGLEGKVPARPMTAQLDEGAHSGPIWVFTARQTQIVENLTASERAFATFSSKGHDIFATIHGQLTVESDRDMVERLWNPFVAAWYDGGKDDPNLVLLRFDADKADIWVDGSSLLAGIKMLFGVDPKQDYKDKIAKVDL